MQQWNKDWLLAEKVGINRSFSGWETVTGEAPQRSMLKSQLFRVYISDLDVLHSVHSSKFADEIKLGDSEK